MLKLLPFLLMIAAAVIHARLAARRTARELDERSAELLEPSLRPALARLAAALDLGAIRVHLYDVPMVNALALHDGRIFVTRGFLDRYRAGQVTAEELTAAIAHEIGHVALGHTRRRLIDFTGQNAAAMGLGMVLGRIIPGLGPLLAQWLMGLVAAGLSRKAEYEADEYAAALLMKAGYGAGPLKSLLRKLGALSGLRGAQPPAWLLTHPKTEARIAAIEAHEARWLGSVSGGSAP
ncbi:Peptidase family M48 [Rubellimicrobium thermophilum DSM 16684]|uniref:Peptidase family M48 n=1 Tax=Rubellimicrobium thermophilum DSM 16684 TaxID=1123069 RepID=S9QWY0_9RHOB|nr:M48 family metallopeptidase [Rubellimicrobium thermophilum]EPX85916.1 Peptidase family M48 [Rubellimicrobium thermophilum DSM 16684]